jgi:hypothetical protein
MMAVITWERMIAAARQGDHELLCLTLEQLEGNLTKAHCRDLANLIRDAFAGNLDRKKKRPKRSVETQAFLDQREFMHVRVVASRLAAEARRQGKTHLRGAARQAALRAILKGLPSAFGKVTPKELDRFARLPKRRRRLLTP